MHLDFSLILTITFVLAVLNICLAASFLIVKAYYRHVYKRDIGNVRSIFSLMKEGKLTIKHIFALLRNMSDSVTLPEEIKRNFTERVIETGYLKKITRGIYSVFPWVRYRYIHQAAFVITDSLIPLLTDRLEKEQKWYIKTAVVSVLVSSGDPDILPDIYRSMENSPDSYRDRCLILLKQMGNPAAYFLLKKAKTVNNPAEQLELLKAIGEFRIPGWREQIRDLMVKPDLPEAEKAADLAFRFLPEIFDDPSFRNHKNPVVRFAALRGYSDTSGRGETRVLISLLEEPGQAEWVSATLSKRVSSDPETFNELIAAFLSAESGDTRDRLTKIFLTKIDYLLNNRDTFGLTVVEEIIRYACVRKIHSHIIAYLNRMHRGASGLPDAAAFLLRVVSDQVSEHPEEYGDFIYLDDEIKDKLPAVQSRDDTNHHKASFPLLNKVILAALLVTAVSLPVLIYLAAAGSPLEMTPFLLFYHTYFAVYAAASNLIFIILLLLASVNLLYQMYNWKSRSIKYLFQEGILPKISLIVPAWNEASGIEDSVRSLLNLRYPDYEIVVVNDGSKDETLDRLIKSFSLEKAEKESGGGLGTAPVRGVFDSRIYKNLTVLDKINGGKADALNAGINHAKGEYICSLDADSMLEPDSLLKAVYSAYTSDRPTYAVGGNVLPVNDSTVEYGQLTRIRLPRKSLVRFQIIEYLRSFLAGRLGWALGNSLMIISGAFSILKRQTVITVGGFLSSRGRLKHNTVGEDMELIVRMHRYIRKKNRRGKIRYSYNANCWTEVPEDGGFFLKQRDRWHRGLLETMMFHKKMLFNPFYGSVGVAAFPYFFLFEVIGPFFELFGFAALIIAGILGILTPQIVLLLFAAVVQLGIVISVSSLIISENGILYYSRRETLVLLAWAFLENFGFRQAVSLYRCYSYVKFLFKQSGWGRFYRHHSSKGK